MKLKRIKKRISVWVRIREQGMRKTEDGGKAKG